MAFTYRGSNFVIGDIVEISQDGEVRNINYLTPTTQCMGFIFRVQHCIKSRIRLVIL